MATNTDPRVADTLARMEARLDLALKPTEDQVLSARVEGNYRGYRDGLRNAFCYAVRHHREGLEMLLRAAEAEGWHGLAETLRRDLDRLSGL